MVAGHLREQNGIYQIILSYKDANGKRKTKQISTGLKIRGNARNAERMLQQARQEFIPPEMAAEQGKEVNPEELSTSDVDTGIHQTDHHNQNDSINCLTDVTAILESTKSAKSKPRKEKYAIPPADPNLMLKPIGQILFCDYMLYWLKSMRHSVDEDTFGGYQCGIESSIYPYFADKGYTLADRVKKPIKEDFVVNIYNSEELDQMFKVFKGDPLELIVILAGYYGLCRSEIIGLKWENIDFVRKTISIKHVVTETSIDGKLKLVKKNKPKTKASTRSLPLVPQLEELLVKALHEQ